MARIGEAGRDESWRGSRGPAWLAEVRHVEFRHGSHGEPRKGPAWSGGARQVRQA